MNEGAFKKAINDKLPKFDEIQLTGIHQQSNTFASLSHNGTPDHYYDGSKQDLWVEYKVLERMPRDGIVRIAPLPGVKKQPRGRLSPQQRRWLLRRWERGRNAIVVVGLPNRTGVIIEGCNIDDENPASIDEAISIKEIACWITDFCGASGSRS